MPAIHRVLDRGRTTLTDTQTQHHASSSDPIPDGDFEVAIQSRGQVQFFVRKATREQQQLTYDFVRVVLSAATRYRIAWPHGYVMPAVAVITLGPAPVPIAIIAYAGLCSQLSAASS